MSFLRARGLSFSYGARTVLDSVGLTVSAGDRIAVVGPNGVGKTTLLRVLAGVEQPESGVVSATGTVGHLPQERELPGSPDAGGMTEGGGTGGRTQPKPGTRSGSPSRPQSQPSSRPLPPFAVAPSAPPMQAGPAGGSRPESKSESRAVARAESMGEYLGRRTGVAQAERALAEAAQALAEERGGADDEYSEALDHYLALGGPDLDVRAEELAAELGLSGDLDRDTRGLSGGQGARLALAAVLLARFDVLLLDEPTNDLDLEGLERLEAHVAALRGGLVVVSHDRTFLERTATEVLRLDPHTHRGVLYGGGYASYLEELERDRRHSREEYEEYAAKRDALTERARRQQEYARSGQRAAHTSGETDKFIRHHMAQTAQRTGAKGAAALRDLERLEEVEEPRKEWELRLRFGAATRSGDIVGLLSGAEVEVGGDGDREPFRLGPVDLHLAWGDRVAVLGPNGSGKTTLIRALLGRAELSAGTRSLGASVVVGEIDQTRMTFDPGAELLEAFRAQTGQDPADARTLLAKFGLGAEHVLRTVRSLSPGERTRADLALLMRQGANLLVLDEPTNHLDLPAIEQLEQALAAYDGTLLLVTHDRRLLERVDLTHRVRVDDGRVSVDQLSPGETVV